MTRDMDILSATFRYSYDFEWDTWYLRPILDAGISQLEVGPASEEGAGAVGFVFDEHNESHFWFRPAIEIGKEYSVTPDYTMRLIMNLGVQKYINGHTTAVRTWFAGAPMGIDPMSVEMNLGDPNYGGRLALEIFSSNDFSAQIYYTGSWYDFSDTNATMLKFQFPLH